MSAWSFRHALLLLVLVFSAAAGVGCQSVFDRIGDLTIASRDRLLAAEAWWSSRGSYEDRPYRGDFGRGFRAGYESVLEGRGGCPPALPPRRYWSAFSQNEQGQGRMHAWFDGFRHGAVAAEASGRAGLNRVVTSRAPLPTTMAPADSAEPSIDAEGPPRTSTVDGDELSPGFDGLRDLPPPAPPVIESTQATPIERADERRRTEDAREAGRSGGGANASSVDGSSGPFSPPSDAPLLRFPSEGPR